MDLDFFEKKPRLDKGKEKAIEIDMDEEDELDEKNTEKIIPPSTKMRRIL